MIDLTGENPGWLAAADFNRDGVLDIATVTVSYTSDSTSDDSLSILLGTGEGKFRRAPAVFLGSTLTTVAIVAADFDQDGLLDVATGDYEARTVSVLINTSRSDRKRAGAAARR